jgi:hypothetical protein
MKTILFVLAIITPTGELQMDTQEVKACPDKGAFFAAMEAMKEKGEIIDWNANCIEVPLTPGQGV